MFTGIDSGRRHFLGLTAMAAANSLPLGWFQIGDNHLPFEGGMPSLRGASAWLNSAEIGQADLLGRVILVDFWTYSCINWRRTLPYLRAWAGKYKQQGLVVVGVHSPEFQFERTTDNVRRATQAMMIDYPVAIDNDFSIWRAFNNEYWPALYLIDAQGRIRHHRFGEGEYDTAEHVIQQLIAEKGATGVDRTLVSIDASGPELGADWRDLRSGENYLGYERTENFASPGGTTHDKQHTYTTPSELKLNHWALAGDWTARKQSISLNAGNGRIAYQFQARDLHLVMGTANQNSKLRFRVYLDGQPPANAHGTDVDIQGFGVIEEPRMYQLIRQREPITAHRFDIEFTDPGAEAYSVTFG